MTMRFNLSPSLLSLTLLCFSGCGGGSDSDEASSKETDSSADGGSGSGSGADSAMGGDSNVGTGGSSNDGNTESGNNAGLVWTKGLKNAVVYDLAAKTGTTLPYWGMVAADGLHFFGNTGTLSKADYRVFDTAGKEVGTMPGEPLYAHGDYMIYRLAGGGAERSRLDGSESAAWDVPDFNTVQLISRDRKVVYSCEKRVEGLSSIVVLVGYDYTGAAPALVLEHSPGTDACLDPIGESLDGSVFWSGNNIIVTDSSGKETNNFVLDASIDYLGTRGPGPNGDDIFVVTDQPSGSHGYLVKASGAFTEVMVPGINLTWAQTDLKTGTILAATDSSLTEEKGLRTAPLDGSGAVSLIAHEEALNHLAEVFFSAP